MIEPKYVFKTMARKELDLAIELAAKEGWNPGLHDADCYFKADPNGFLMGVVGDEPVATISVVKYDSSFGFLGSYIVKPEFRGQGYGIKLWNAGIEYLAGCNIALDGVVAQQENYKTSGFKFAYRNIRFEGKGGLAAPDHTSLVELSDVPFEIIDAYDRPFFPAKRSSFVQAWISQPDSFAVGIMNSNELAGYGVIRKCRVGYKLGPLFADSPKFADLLFQALSAKVKTTDAIFLDVPEVNQSAVELAERYGMQVCFETARMYTDEFPELPLRRLYGVASFEIG